MVAVGCGHSVESVAEFEARPAVAEVRAELDWALANFEEAFPGVALRRIVVTVEEDLFGDRRRARRRGAARAGDDDLPPEP